MVRVLKPRVIPQTDYILYLFFLIIVDAIIFLAPISAFDQVLTEDHKVNRLEDSVLLWKAVCSNKLLANVDLVLFLNKCDLLERKLDAGVRLAKYVKSYGDRSNDLETASKCACSAPSLALRFCQTLTSLSGCQTRPYR